MDNLSILSNTGGRLAEQDNYTIRTILIGALSLSVCFGFLLLIPSFLVAANLGPGAFLFQERYVIDSPDTPHRLRVFRRINFPVDSIIDPSATVAVTVENTLSSEVVAEHRNYIYEHPELQKPELEWRGDSVLVKGIEYRRETEFLLALR